MKLHCVVTPDAGLWRLTRAYLGACQNQVGDIGDDQCHVVGLDCRVVSTDKVECGVCGEGSTGVVEVVEEAETEVALWTLLVRGGLDIELSVLSSDYAGKDQHSSAQQTCTFLCHLCFCSHSCYGLCTTEAVSFL